MAAVPERRVPLPVTTRRVVWVVDEWYPGCPGRPRSRSSRWPTAASLYVLPVRRGAVDYAGYHLVPVTAVARAPR